ncbi:MAG: glycoside hydrolase family 27 protein, partial [Candidatus Thalassarchaeaceae archaeon]
MLNEVQKIILLNKDVIAINQDVTPQGHVVVEGDSTVWARHLTGGDVALALYNEEDAPKSIGARFDTFGWTSSTKA